MTSSSGLAFISAVFDSKLRLLKFFHAGVFKSGLVSETNLFLFFIDKKKKNLVTDSFNKAWFYYLNATKQKKKIQTENFRL